MNAGEILGLLGTGLGAGSVILAAWLSARASRRIAAEAQAAHDEQRRQSRDVERVKVDAEAYTRAQRINDDIVAALRQEISRLNSELDSLRAQLRVEQGVSAELTAKVVALQATVDRMRVLLANHHIPVPNPE